MVHETGEGINVQAVEQDLKFSIINRYETLEKGWETFLREQVLINNLLSLEDTWKAHTGDYYNKIARKGILLKKQNLIQAGTWSGGTGTPYQVGQDLGHLEIEGTPNFLAWVNANRPAPIIAEPAPITDFLPEILPQVYAMPTSQGLSNQVIQIINNINNGSIQIPDWFKNNVQWVQDGHITQEAFLTAYDNLIERGIIHVTITPPAPDDNISNNMVIQRVNDFFIINGRAKGSITFTATDNFNPYYYGKDIVNIVQFKTPNGANILPFIKQNRLNFTATERDETIFYDEDMKGNTRATVESFVWEWIDKPAGAFSKPFSVNISEEEPAKPLQTGIMGAGVGGAIGILILLGFIADSRRKK